MSSLLGVRSEVKDNMKQQYSKFFVEVMSLTFDQFCLYTNDYILMTAFG